MQRVAFILKVKKDKIEEYKRRHKQVWPEMLEALRETGWHNYTLFLRDDGLLVGYCETPNFKKAVEGMQKKKINALWQAEMKEFFEELDSGAADTSMKPLEEVFHLD